MTPAPDLLHTALNRHATQYRGSDGEPLSPSALERLHLADEHDERIEVRTPAASTAGSVASSPSSSRSASPTRAAGKRKGGAGKPRRDKTKEREKSEAMKNPSDPFLRFPGPVLGRVLGELGYHDLLSVGLVCKRWRRSQTLSEYSWLRWLLSCNNPATTPSCRRHSLTDALLQTTPGIYSSTITRTPLPLTVAASTPRRTASRPGGAARRRKIGRRTLPAFSVETTSRSASRRTRTRMG